jgi:phosphohistidine phosphatase
MKKTLFLVRHAQASSSVSPDIFRPLTPSGMIDAARMSRHLADKLTGIELILTSNSERTRMTTQVFCEQLKLDEGMIQEEASLYESTPNIISMPLMLYQRTLQWQCW